jgi:hypothetical protein
MDTLLRVQQWYTAQCNGDWEHTYGLNIQTSDNPGWIVEIDLSETALEGRAFTKIGWGDSEEDASWLHCRVEANTFHGSCGASQLAEVLDTFLSWAEASRFLGTPPRTWASRYPISPSEAAAHAHVGMRSNYAFKRTAGRVHRVS